MNWSPNLQKAIRFDGGYAGALSHRQDRILYKYKQLGHTSIHANSPILFSNTFEYARLSFLFSLYVQVFDRWFQSYMYLWARVSRLRMEKARSTSAPRKESGDTELT
jgi:hypothetical protein